MLAYLLMLLLFFLEPKRPCAKIMALPRGPLSLEGSWRSYANSRRGEKVVEKVRCEMEGAFVRRTERARRCNSIGEVVSCAMMMYDG